MIGRRPALWVAVLLAAACAGPSGRAATSAPVPTGPAPAASGTAAPTPSSSFASSPSLTVAFPDLAVLVGTSDGDVYTRLVGGRPAGTKTRVCDGYIVRIESAGPLDLVSCIQGSAFSVYTYDHRTNAVAPISGVDGPAIWTDTGDAILYVTRGSCPPAQQDCATRLVRRDLRTGALVVIDERVGVLTDFRTTEEGPTVWRAKNAVTFVRPDADVGTYVVRGTALSKFSSFRLVAGFKGRWLLESEETGSFNSGCCAYVIQRTTAEARLTPAGVTNERAVALLADGRMLAFRPAGDGPEGTMVVYGATGGRIERSDRGSFTAFRVVSLEPDWVIGFEYAGAPSLTLRAYRIADGAFAAAAGGTITTLAALPPR